MHRFLPLAPPKRAWLHPLTPLLYILVRFPLSQLFSRLRSSSLSLSSQETCSSPLIIFVALHWTQSRSSTSLSCCRVQSWTQHCRCGLSRVTQHGSTGQLLCGMGERGRRESGAGALCTHRDLPPEDAGICASTAWGEAVPAAGGARSEPGGVHVQHCFWGNGSQVRDPTHITVRHHNPGHLHWLVCHDPDQLCPQSTCQ